MKRSGLSGCLAGVLLVSMACGSNTSSAGNKNGPAATQSAAAGFQATTRDINQGKTAGQPAASTGPAVAAGPKGAAGPAGALDTTFGSGGVITTDIGDDSEAASIVLQPDGKFVVGGRTLPKGKQTEFALARYNADGSLDGTFGTAGKVITGFTTAAGQDIGGDISALAMQSDGKIVAVGGVDGKFGAVRYDKSGRLDPSFGTGGKVVTPFGQFSVPYSVAVQTDGKIVVAGTNSTHIGNGHYSFDSLLFRYNPDGTADQSFGDHGQAIDRSVNILTSGTSVTPPGSSAPSNPTEIRNFTSYIATGLVLQPDKKIVTAGAVNGGGTFLMAARYDLDGSHDKNWPLDSQPFFAGNSSGMALQTDGKILITGITREVATGGTSETIVIERLNADATADKSFGAGGLVTITNGGRVDSADSIVLQGDGKVVVVGSSDGLVALLRLLPNGAVDAGFGNGGRNVTAIAGDARSAVSQKDGKLVVAGWTSAPGATDGPHHILLARFRN